MHRILISLALTFIAAFIGYLAQRSRMCFIAGLRDFIIVRDKELLMGMVSLIVSLWFLSSLFYSQGWLNSSIPQYGDVLAPVKQIEKTVDISGESDSPDKENGQESIEQSGLRIIPIYPNIPGGKFLWTSIIGGFLMGVMSVQAGGCVLRQHVMAAQGSMDAWYFLAGLYAAVLAYDFLLRPFVDSLYL